MHGIVIISVEVQVGNSTAVMGSIGNTDLYGCSWAFHDSVRK